jgi:hypothetical protein
MARTAVSGTSLSEQSTVIDPAQAWFWSDRWQAMEREAGDDVAAGRVKRFNDVESLLAELDEEE